MQWNELLSGIGRSWSSFSSRPPADYRPGVTLERAVRELAPVFRSAPDHPERLLLPRPDGSGATVLATERVERHFLMHLVGIELAMAVPGPGGPAAVIEVRNTGMVKRTGVSCSSSSKDPDVRDLLQAVQSDGDLRQALMTLDFRSIRLKRDTGGWLAVIEPYGACEVVNRMPSFRRYVRLGSEQVPALARVFLIFNRIYVTGVSNEHVS